MWTAAIATFGEGSMLHTSLRTIRAAIFAAADAAAAEEDAASDAASAHADEDVDMQPAAAPLRLVLGLSAEQMLQAERSERLLTALRDARTMSVELRGATDDFDVKALEVTAVAQRRGTRIVITPTDEDGEAVTLFTSQLEDHCDEEVKRVCLQYRLAREVGSSSSVSLAKQQARERRLKLALVAEQAKQLHEAQLEELRARGGAREGDGRAGCRALAPGPRAACNAAARRDRWRAGALLGRAHHITAELAHPRQRHG
jgi:hypothetical protein